MNITVLLTHLTENEISTASILLCTRVCSYLLCMTGTIAGMAFDANSREMRQCSDMGLEA